jgi:hypothetical protein
MRAPRRHFGGNLNRAIDDGGTHAAIMPTALSRRKAHIPQNMFWQVHNWVYYPIIGYVPGTSVLWSTHVAFRRPSPVSRVPRFAANRERVNQFDPATWHRIWTRTTALHSTLAWRAARRGRMIPPA